MRAIYPVLRKYCLVGVQGNHYLQVNENKRRVSELSISVESHSVWAIFFPRLALMLCSAPSALLRSPRIKSPCSCCPPACPLPLAQSRCQQFVPLLIFSVLLLVPVPGGEQVTQFLRLWLRRCPWLAAAVGPCWASLRQTRWLLTLRTAALQAGPGGHLG